VTGTLFGGNSALAIICVAGVLLLIAMILAYWLARDPSPRFRRTRVGVFIERDRHDDEWPDPHDLEKTAEYPPIKEDK
jgi:hypothetical protein